MKRLSSLAIAVIATLVLLAGILMMIRRRRENRN